MQRPDTLFESFQRGFPAVDDHIVGERQARLARCLCRHDTLNSCPRQPAAGLDAGHLRVGVAVHHTDPNQPFMPLARLYQQRHDKHDITALRNPRSGLGFSANHGMENGLQPLARLRAMERQFPHGGPVQSAVLCNDVWPKTLPYRFDGCPSGRGEVMCNDIGIDNGSTPGAEHVGNLALARTDSACEAHLEHERDPAQIKRYCTSVPSKITPAEGMEMKGPKGSDADPAPRILAVTAKKTPPRHAASMMPGKGPQPAHAPTAARSFISPPPTPAWPRQNWYSVSTRRRPPYPRAAPATACSSATPCPAQASSNPAHNSGSVSASGSKPQRASMRDSARSTAQAARPAVAIRDGSSTKCRAASTSTPDESNISEPGWRISASARQAENASVRPSTDAPRETSRQ